MSFYLFIYIYIYLYMYISSCWSVISIGTILSKVNMEISHCEHHIHEAYTRRNQRNSYQSKKGYNLIRNLRGRRFQRRLADRWLECTNVIIINLLSSYYSSPYARRNQSSVWFSCEFANSIRDCTGDCSSNASHNASFPPPPCLIYASSPRESRT